MANDIKRLLDEIIDDTDHQKNTGAEVPAIHKPVTHTMSSASFDSADFREKLSMCVLKDVISAMMHDDTADIGGMIDQSIMDHIHNDYKGTCFGYLCKSRDKLQSPILGDIVQEIENTADEADEEVNNSGVINNNIENPEIATKDILDNVNSYDELRKKLKEEVSKKVVNDVTKVITKSNDAPVFDNIDKSLKKVDTQSPEGDASMNPPIEAQPGNTENVQAPPQQPPTENVATESVIFNMCSSIVTEAAMNGVRMSSDEGLNRAIITYCIGEMDALFGMDRSRSIVRKYLK